MTTEPITEPITETPGITPTENPGETLTKTSGETTKTSGETPRATSLVVKVTSEKNPKRVEAGRKGAAARKIKKEKMLNDLQKAKESILTRTPAEPQNPNPPKHEHHCSFESKWVVGCAAAVAAAIFIWLLHQKNNNDNDSVINNNLKKKSPISYSDNVFEL